MLAVARLAGKVGGLTEVFFTGLCGALPAPKCRGAIFLVVVAVMFAGFGCGGRTNSGLIAQHNCYDTGGTSNNAIVEEYIDTDGAKVIKYGTADLIDSIMIFNSTGYLQTIQYGFGSDIPANFVLQKKYYDNGNIWGIEITKDTLIVIDGHHLRAYKWEAFYHSNGSLRMKGYSTGGLMVGQWLIYDSSGYLIEECMYVPINYNSDSSYFSVKTFYPSGALREEKRYSYFADIDVPKGIWKYYNEKGAIYKTEEYENGKLIRTIKNENH